MLEHEANEANEAYKEIIKNFFHENIQSYLYIFLDKESLFNYRCTSKANKSKIDAYLKNSDPLVSSLYDLTTIKKFAKPEEVQRLEKADLAPKPLSYTRYLMLKKLQEILKVFNPYGQDFLLAIASGQKIKVEIYLNHLFTELDGIEYLDRKRTIKKVQKLYSWLIEPYLINARHKIDSIEPLGYPLSPFHIALRYQQLSLFHRLWQHFFSGFGFYCSRFSSYFPRLINYYSRFQFPQDLISLSILFEPYIYKVSPKVKKHSIVELLTYHNQIQPIKTIYAYQPAFFLYSLNNDALCDEYGPYLTAFRLNHRELVKFYREKFVKNILLDYLMPLKIKEFLILLKCEPQKRFQTLKKSYQEINNICRFYPEFSEIFASEAFWQNSEALGLFLLEDQLNSAKWNHSSNHGFIFQFIKFFHQAIIKNDKTIEYYKEFIKKNPKVFILGDITKGHIYRHEDQLEEYCNNLKDIDAYLKKLQISFEFFNEHILFAKRMMAAIDLSRAINQSTDFIQATETYITKNVGVTEGLSVDLIALLRKINSIDILNYLIDHSKIKIYPENRLNDPVYLKLFLDFKFSKEVFQKLYEAAPFDLKNRVDLHNLLQNILKNHQKGLLTYRLTILATIANSSHCDFSELLEAIERVIFEYGEGIKKTCDFLYWKFLKAMPCDNRVSQEKWLQAFFYWNRDSQDFHLQELPSVYQSLNSQLSFETILALDLKSYSFSKIFIVFVMMLKDLNLFLSGEQIDAKKRAFYDAIYKVVTALNQQSFNSDLCKVERIFSNLHDFLSRLVSPDKLSKANKHILFDYLFQVLKRQSGNLSFLAQCFLLQFLLLTNDSEFIEEKMKYYSIQISNEVYGMLSGLNSSPNIGGPYKIEIFKAFIVHKDLEKQEPGAGMAINVLPQSKENDNEAEGGQNLNNSLYFKELDDYLKGTIFSYLEKRFFCKAKLQQVRQYYTETMQVIADSPQLSPEEKCMKLTIAMLEHLNKRRYGTFFSEPCMPRSYEMLWNFVKDKAWAKEKDSVETLNGKYWEHAQHRKSNDYRLLKNFQPYYFGSTLVTRRGKFG